MEDLHLSDTLQRYFSDVFLCCDEEKSGKATVSKTIELIESGTVPEDVISQISEICWTPNTSHLNKKQFFSALKLVAAYQANIPIRSDVVTSKVDLPLPRFTWTIIENTSPVQDLIELRRDLNNYTEQVSRGDWGKATTLMMNIHPTKENLITKIIQSV